MALRIKTKWHRSNRSERNKAGSSKQKTIEDLAGVIAFNIWKVSQETYKRMEKEGFHFREDKQVSDIITEVIAFLVQVADRMVYGKIDEEERTRFVTALAQELGKTLDSNLRDLFGKGDYIQPFFNTLNERFADYAEFPFEDNQPSYGAKRYLGDKIAEHMKATDNKWVLEQVIDIEVPEALKIVQRMVIDVMGLRERS
ncbi:MAG: hypothetical protein OEW89_00290 [Gammaproteobacteria bacterium]|nr:hypothetical protein [Gammaproteobacteria bacterium]MDH5593393.1 hypothetical protein [Gammaproteobacteria bacterium]